MFSIHFLILSISLIGNTIEYFVNSQIIVCEIWFLHVRVQYEDIWYGCLLIMMLITDIGDKRCWWQVWDIAEQFNTLKNHQHNENSRRYNDSVTNILDRLPSLRHPIVATNITFVDRTGLFYHTRI